MSFLYGVNFCLALCMAITLRLKKQEHSAADHVLIFYMSYVALLFLMLAVSSNDGWLPYPLKVLVGGAAFTPVASLLLSYIVELVGKPRRWHMFIVTPAVLHIGGQLVHVLSSTEEYYFIYGVSVVPVDGMSSLLLASALFFLLLALPVVGLLLVGRHKEQILERYSDMTRISLDWVTKLLWGMSLFLVIVGMLVGPLQAYFSVPLEVSLFGFFLSVSILHFYIGWHGLEQQRVVFLGTQNKSRLRAEPSPTLDADSEYLLSFMDSQRPYIRQKLTLDELAEALGWPDFQVSETIRDGLRLNFHDFVNGYRVAEVKRLLADPNNKTVSLLSIAFDAGFNSKTAFNSAFKKVTGMPPSVYRRHLKANS